MIETINMIEVLRRYNKAKWRAEELFKLTADPNSKEKLRSFVTLVYKDKDVTVNGEKLKDRTAEIIKQYKELINAYREYRMLDEIKQVANLERNITVRYNGKSETMSVAKALAMCNKTHVGFLKWIIEKLKTDKKDAITSQNLYHSQNNNDQTVGEYFKQRMALLLKESPDNLPDPNEIKNEWIMCHTLELIDPINIDHEVEKLEEELAYIELLPSKIATCNANSFVRIDWDDYTWQIESW